MHSPTLLGLPSDIRRNILRLAGLVRDFPIGPNIEKHQLLRRHRSRVALQDCHFFPPEEWEKLPVELLRVCKTISEESHSVLYGENSLMIDTDCGGNLIRQLQRMSRSSLARLQSLYIVIPSHVLRDGEINNYNQFSDICHFLGDKLTPNQVTVSCSFGLTGPASLETRKYLEPLQFLPKLYCLNVQLLKSREALRTRPNGDDKHSFRSMCQYFARLLVYSHGPSNPQTIFPFTRLPWELQHLVLSHSDCVSTQDVQQPVPGFPKIKDISCCGYCGIKDIKGCWCNTDALFLLVCIDRYSSTCICRPLSSGLFLVSRNLREQAQHIYYTMNVFTFGSRRSPVGKLAQEVRQVSGTILRRLHTINIWFNPYLPWTIAERETWQEILLILRTHCIDFVKIKITLWYSAWHPEYCVGIVRIMEDIAANGLEEICKVDLWYVSDDGKTECIAVLKGLADEGRTLVMTTHQSRSDLWQSFANV